MSPPADPSEQVAAGAARDQLARILASRHFAKADGLRRFLAFVSEETLNGRAVGIKETTVGIDVFGRPAATFDPRMDPIVRVQAGRLRARLDAYYEEEGAGDPVQVELPRGQYVPRFTSRSSAPASHGGAIPRGLAAWQANAVAVLPFVNLGGDPADDYFSDGLTEELTHSLARLPSLRVTARRSAFRFRDRDSDVREIGRMLGAGKIVEGSVRKSAGRLRITVQLVNVADGVAIWSETYDRTVGDVFALQEAIATDVRRALRARLGEPRGQGAAMQTASVEALNQYLLGRFHWNKRSAAGLRAGIAHLTAATGIDPAYARAWSGLADCYIMLAISGAERPLAVMPLASQAALRAVELDDGLVEAHTSLAVVRANFDWDRSAAEVAFQRALECDPTYATLHHWYSLYLLTPERRHDEAEDEIEWAERLDPVSLPINLGHAQVLLLAGDAEGAIAQCRKVLALDPAYYRAYWFLGIAHDSVGNFEAAVDALQTARTRGGDEAAFRGRILGALGHACAGAGRHDAALTILNEMSALSRDASVDPFDFAQIHAGLADTDAALEDLERAAAERSGYLAFAGSWPAFRALRSHDRFRALLAQMSLGGE